MNSVLIKIKQLPGRPLNTCLNATQFSNKTIAKYNDFSFAIITFPILK